MKSKSICKKTLLSHLVEEFNINFVFVALFGALTMKAFCEGYCTSISVLTSPFLESSIDRSTVNVMMRSSFFVGSFFSPIPTEIWKNSSQRNLMIGLSLLSVSTSLLYLFSASVVIISFSNFVLGFCYGAMIVIAGAMSVDLVRSTVRPVLFTWIWMSYPAGGITACFVCKATNLLEHPEKINQATFVLLCMGVGVSMFAFMLKETPKYLLAEKRHDEAFEVLEYMLGDKKYLLTEETAAVLSEPEMTTKEKANATPIDWWTVTRLTLPIFLSFGMFAAIITYVPSLKEEDEALSTPDRMIRNILILVSFCFPADIVSGILPSVKWIGRLGFVYMFASISTGLLFLSLFVSWKLIPISIAFGCCSTCGGIETLLACERAQPEHRNTTASIACASGRLSKALFVAIIEGTLSISNQGSLVFLFLGELITLASIALIPIK